jgi:hypothetical protein
MSDAVRGRARRVTLDTIVLAAATVSARHISKLGDRPSLARSFDADVGDWTDGAPGSR